jgi:hypothetical protein
MAASQFDFLNNMAGFYYPGTNPALYSGSPTPTTYTANPAYSSNPAYQSGTGAFGQVPGALGVPNPAGNLATVVPGLSKMNETLSGDILAKLGGQLSPATLNAIKDAGAAWGVQSGVPGSGIAANRTLRDLGLSTEAQIAQGIQEYNQTIPTISRTQTVSPELQTQIAEINAINAAAPNPQAQASFALQLFNSYLNRMKGSSGQRPSGISSVGGRQEFFDVAGAPKGDFGLGNAPFEAWYGAGG